MDKVKITQEQADVLETELKSSHIQGNKSKFVKMFVNLEGDDWEEGYPLTCLDKDKLIRALYIGYVVEEKPEDMVRKYFLEQRKLIPTGQTDDTYYAIAKTLNLLNIKIEGVNA